MRHWGLIKNSTTKEDSIPFYSLIYSRSESEIQNKNSRANSCWYILVRTISQQWSKAGVILITDSRQNVKVTHKVMTEHQDAFHDVFLQNIFWWVVMTSSIAVLLFFFVTTTLASTFFLDNYTYFKAAVLFISLHEKATVSLELRWIRVEVFLQDLFSIHLDCILVPFTDFVLKKLQYRKWF